MGAVRSIWDTFSHTPGKVQGGDTGDIACDSYHRSEEDLGLLSELGVGAYRFSIAWPRVQPTGRGEVNQRGLDHYRSLIEGLRDRGIAPVATVYHWELPQALEDRGGWASRETAQRFAEYAELLAQEFGDQVAMWITLNEPLQAAHQGYRVGTHAPGKTDATLAAAATHHLLLGHGLALEAMRSVLPGDASIGISLDLHPIRAAGDEAVRGRRCGRRRSQPDLPRAGVARQLPGGRAKRAAARAGADRAGRHARDLRRGRLPRPQLLLAALRAPAETGTICARARVRWPATRAWSATSRRRSHGRSWAGSSSRTACTTRSGRCTGRRPTYRCTSPRTAARRDDYVTPEGDVNDLDRVDYLHGHLDAAWRAIQDGVNLSGYFHWSLMDNFEWARGYQRRFGLYFVDFGTQRRLPKRSAVAYSRVARTNSLPGDVDSVVEHPLAHASSG